MKWNPARELSLAATLALPCAALEGSASESIAPLRMGKAIPVLAGNVGSGFQGPLLCDAEGNIAFVPSALDARSRPMDPDRVVRVSADGKSAAEIRLASVPDLEDVADSSFEAVAFGHDGTVHALVKGPKHQILVSFSQDGRYRSKTEVDFRKFALSSFAAFESGEFLLWGRSPESPTEGRVAVLGSTAGMVDVTMPEGAPGTSRRSTLARMKEIDLAIAEPARDGSVYYAQSVSDGHVYAVSPSGEASARFALPPPRVGAVLTSIKVSGPRLAAIFREARKEGEGMTSWVAVHQLSSGDRLATYGPVRNFVLCYRSGDGMPDSFTLLGMDETGRLQLIPASAP